MPEPSTSPLSDSAIASAADVLLAARRDGTSIERLPPECTPATVEDAYRIQQAGHQRAGEALGPWKVGATSSTAQQVLGVSEPFIGRPPIDRLIADGSQISMATWFLGTPAIEVEIGLLPRHDLTEVPDDPTELAAAVHFVPCLELVNSRFTDMTLVGAPSLIADNAVASAIVQAEPVDLEEEQIRALDSLTVGLSIDGNDVATGTGAMALGHPLNVLHLAASRALAWGSPIRAGELVITGTCTGLVPATIGAAITGHFDHGSVTVHFT